MRAWHAAALTRHELFAKCRGHFCPPRRFYGRQGGSEAFVPCSNFEPYSQNILFLLSVVGRACSKVGRGTT